MNVTYAKEKNARLGDSSYELFYNGLFWKKTNLKQGAYIYQSTAWPVPHAYAQPYHPGSGSHGQRFRLCWHTDQGNPWSAFPVHGVGELPYGSQLTTPTCVVWSWRLKECYAILMSTKLSGCHCPGDMAVRMREVLSRPWVGACVPLALGLSCFANNFLPSHFYRLYWLLYKCTTKILLSLLSRLSM